LVISLALGKKNLCKGNIFGSLAVVAQQSKNVISLTKQKHWLPIVDLLKQKVI
jgi:hypothetical protein